MSLPELEFTESKFLDRSTILYGASASGKSTVIINILHELKNSVDQIIVISPTDRQNHTYDAGIVPPPCIHYDMTATLLDNIWARQEMMTSVYTRANKPKVLEQLFKRISDANVRKIITDTNEKLMRIMRDLEGNDAEIKKVKEECAKFVVLVQKDAINKNRRALERCNLSDDEKYSLKYFNMNPRLVLIFDDCTNLLKKFSKHQVMQKIFYQGRWNYITIIIAAHTDKVLDPELKKNAFVTIFTEPTSARSYINRPSNDFDTPGKRAALDHVKTTFTPLAKYQKFAYIRDEDKFYRFTASIPEKFRFGSNILWEYCDKVKTEAGAIAGDNKFVNNFD